MQRNGNFAPPPPNYYDFPVLNIKIVTLSSKIVRIRAVPPARRGTGWERFSRRRRTCFVGLPVGRCGKGFRLFTAGWEWDGNVGSHLVDGTRRDHTISRWDGTGRDRGTSREYSREISREYDRETLSGMVGNTMGNWGWG